MNASSIPVHLQLDANLFERARALGPLDRVVESALREALSPETAARRRRWLEENALLVEALCGGAEEVQLR